VGFYLRKSLRMGPIRLNLSKSGLGVSAGVRGARIGVSSRGRAYVHAGRGGLYLRQNIPGRRLVGPSSGSGPVLELIEDSGVTFGIQRIERSVSIQDRIVRSPAALTPSLILGAISLVSVYLGAVLESDAPWLAFVGAAGVLLSAVLIGRVIEWNRKAGKLQQLVNRELSELRPLTHVRLSRLATALRDPDVREVDRQYIAQTALLGALDRLIADRRISDDELEFLAQIEKALPVSADFAHQARLELFREAYFQAVADHDLETREEALLDEIRSRLAISDDAIRQELSAVEDLRALRSVRQGSLTPIETSVPLQKSEECYFESAARLLKETTLRRIQRDHQRYAIRGFVVDTEGTLIVTNKRVVVVHEGTTSLRAERILDVDVDADRNLIKIIRDGSRRPMYLTCPNAARADATIATVAGV
jgi:Protein of unknown function (DUF4236)